MTSDALIYAYLQRRRDDGLADGSIDAYGYDLVKFAKFLAPRHVTEAAEADVIAWLLALEQARYSAVARSRKLSVLRGFFHFAVANHRATTNPTTKVCNHAKLRRCVSVASRLNVEALLAAPDRATLRGARDYAMIRLVCTTGIRSGEIVALAVADFDATTPCVYVGERRLPLDVPTRDAIATYVAAVRPAWAARGNSDGLFLSWLGSTMTRQGFWKIVLGYAVRADVRGNVSPQTLRHAFALDLLRRGADHEHVKTLLGHAQVETTRAMYMRPITSGAR